MRKFSRNYLESQTLDLERHSIDRGKDYCLQKHLNHYFSEIIF